MIFIESKIMGKIVTQIDKLLNLLGISTKYIFLNLKKLKESYPLSIWD